MQIDLNKGTATPVQANVSKTVSKDDALSIDAHTRRIYPDNTENTWWIALFAIAGLLGLAMFSYGQAQDNDMWWLFATGREIVEHGIPYENPFSAYGDQAIVVQQWIPCVICYLVYSWFGFTGIGVIVVATSVLFAFCSYFFAKIVSHGRGNEITFVAMTIMMGAATSYLSVRPQVWSMIAYMLILTVMEKYKQSNNWKILCFLPIIMIVHVNFHLSLALFDVVIVGMYLLPDISKQKIKDMFTTYSRITIIVAICVMLFSSLLNPYGLDGALYIVHSYSAASYQDFIMEMNALTPWTSYYGACMIVMIILGAAGIGKSGRKRCNLPLTFLFLIACVMSLQHVRNVWLAALFGFALFVYAYSNLRFRTSNLILRDDTAKIAFASITCLLILFVGVSSQTDFLNNQPEDNTSTPVEAADYIEAHVSDGDSANVFTHFNAGGYLEWRGFKVSMDARPELWNSLISKNGIDRYTEYVDMSLDDMSAQDYMTGKEFDFMIVDTDTSLYKYLSGSIDYNKALDGNGYVLFQRHVKGNPLNSANVVETTSVVDNDTNIEDSGIVADEDENSGDAKSAV